MMALGTQPRGGWGKSPAGALEGAGKITPESEPCRTSHFCTRIHMAKTRSTLLVGKRLHAGVKTAQQYLTGLDIFHAHAGIPVVLVYNKGFDLALAERALGETLKQYPILAGRYKKDAQGHVYIDGNDGGIDFRVHRCAGKMPYGPHKPVGKDINKLFKLVLPWQVVDKDTALFQINIHQYEDDGIVLCCYAPHSMLDGSSFWGFMLDWSRACRGMEIKAPTSFDRGIMIEAGQTEVDPASYDLMVAPRVFDFIGIMSRLAWGAVTLKSEVFRIPASAVQQWKSQAKIELPDSAGVSPVELMSAYVMKAFSPWMPKGVARSVGLVLDLRYKRRLKLPRDYFGNALCYAEARYSEQELAQGSLPVLAEKCRPPNDQVSTGSLFKMLALTEQYRQKKAVWRLIFKPTIETVRAGFVQNNVVQMPIYDIDLGRGTPDWYDICPMTIRMLMVAATPSKDGGLVLYLTARKAELKALRAQLAADGIAA
jgi:shikimate O-hydroxycinnamoyltransferase